MKFVQALAAAFLLLIAPAFAGSPSEAFDPRSLQQRVHGAPTQLLVLGTPHLSGAPDDFDPAVLEPLLQRLAAFEPDVIAIENLSGESIRALKDYEAIYHETADVYGGRLLKGAALAAGQIGLDLPAAETEVRRTLAEFPDAPSPAQRRQLAALFAASGDTHSALVQWWRLPEAERVAADGVSPELAAFFGEYDTRRNESHLIGARLAERLGLERVYPIDDHHSDDLVYPIIPQLSEFFEAQNIGAVFEMPEYQRLIQATDRLRTPEEALDTYRYLNSPEAGQLDVALQWALLIDRPSPDHAGRVRMAEWEARNLRQVAHIREAMAQAPGGRVLVIIGSAHKPWLDAYLAMISDIEVVDAATVLGEP